MTSPPPGQDLPDALELEVLAILDGDVTARDAALAQLCAQHARFADTIRAWLAQVGIPLPGAAPHSPATPHPAGTDAALPRDLGPYRLTALLGRGGFGSVFRADQLTPIRRTVAVKVINPGMDSREILARFHAEREALNRMDHPGIARLLDAGSTEQGRPFFVMELVDGPPLALLCRQRALPLERRIALFLMVLDAMEHAHQKAVIHRDLSSNNVLVAEHEGHLQPKIIDFGIAKSLADPLLRGGAMTFHGTLMGTPEFMSPEQAAGLVADVDTRADVYALGVQLYELLCDRLPIPSHVLRAQGPNGIARIIAAHVPEPPSAIAPAERQAGLRGDLDAITLRALAKRRGERYASVAEFAADVRAFLAHEPVRAREPSTWYRVRKFVRRHRTESFAIALLTLALLGGTGVLWWALVAANTARHEAEQEKTNAEARADAGFRLLANEIRLRAAIAAADGLPPPWPAHRNALAGWLAEFGRPLVDERKKLAAKLAELADARQRGGDRFADVADEHLWQALQRLQGELDTFAGGPLRRADRRLRLLDEILAPALVRDRELWQGTIAAVRAAYRGLALHPLPGITPLGRNPTTGLYEFGDLVTAASGDPIVFVLIPAGTFRIGAFRGEPGLQQNDPDAEDDELRGELWRLDDFLLARTELSRAQWSALAEEQPPADAALPVTGIDWHEACAVLRRFDLELPTEAQWEYACRAGTTTPWSSGNAPPAGIAERGAAAPATVASGAANGFGLYGMHGNVAEWCRDPKLPYELGEPRAGDGLREVAEHDGERVVRGGSWRQDPRATRSAARDSRLPPTREPAIGLRPVRRLR